jgi:hypothetical protein
MECEFDDILYTKYRDNIRLMLGVGVVHSYLEKPEGSDH